MSKSRVSCFNALDPSNINKWEVVEGSKGMLEPSYPG
jgi:hypothetical protein